MAKILIIGGGVAGLSAGIYARKHGHQAIVCERHFIAGGNLTGWQRGEYHIDNCIHWLTGTNPNTDTYRTWTELGALGDTPVYQPETLYTYEADGNRLSLDKDLKKLEGDMLALSPADKKEIRALIHAVQAVQGVCAIAGENHDEKSSFWQRTHTCPPLLKYFRLSTGELSKRFSHPLIQQFLSSFIGEDFSAIALITVFATFCGGNGGLPQGGSLAMAKRMTDRFVSLGGELLLKKEATKIHVRGGKATSVSFADGTKIRADYIVATIDPKITFPKLLKREMPKALKSKYDDPKSLCFSSVHCAFSCPQNKLPFSGDLIFEIPDEYKETLSANHLVLREFSHEKSFAPSGKTVLQALVFCYEKQAREFISLRKNKAAYNRKKDEIATCIETVIAKKFPKLTGKLERLDVWTPATYERYTGAETGAYMSFILQKNTVPRRIKSTVKGLKNVVLATQWQQSPGGLPIAAGLGKQAIDEIVKKEARILRSKKAKILLPLPRKRKRA